MTEQLTSIFFLSFPKLLNFLLILCNYTHQLLYMYIKNYVLVVFRITSSRLDNLFLTMDPRHSVQDALRCTLCKTEEALMYCNVCHTHLCKDCLAIHFSDKSGVHNVVSIDQFLSTLNNPKCPKHPTKQCELQCKQCDIPICATCISSRKHFGHEIVDIFEDFEAKTKF